MLQPSFLLHRVLTPPTLKEQCHFFEFSNKNYVSKKSMNQTYHNTLESSYLFHYLYEVFDILNACLIPIDIGKTLSNSTKVVCSDMTLMVNHFSLNLYSIFGSSGFVPYRTPPKGSFSSNTFNQNTRQRNSVLWRNSRLGGVPWVEYCTTVIPWVRSCWAEI